MVISLISPTSSDFIKNWPSQHAVNCERIDEYAGPCLTSDALQSYTPQLLSTGTVPTLGTDSYIRGFYYKIFDQIYTWGEFKFGTAGISVGTGIWSVTLPFEATTLGFANETPARGTAAGGGVAWDASTLAGRQPVMVQLRTNTTIQFNTRMGSSSDVVGSTIPFSWAINDSLSWYARYKRAS